MSKDTIIYIGGFELPDRNAAAHRVIANSKIFKMLGYNVVLSGVSKERNKKKYSEYDRFYPNSKYEWIKYLTKNNEIDKIIKNIGKEKIYAIVAYNFPAIALNKLIKKYKHHNIKIIADATEWYDPSDNKKIFSLIKKLDTKLRMENIHLKCDGIIYISKYLENYYSGKGMKGITLPPLVDLEEQKWKTKKNNSNKIRTFLYAASKGSFNDQKSKESLSEIIDVFYRIQKKSEQYKLIIIGADYEFLEQRYIDKANKLNYIKSNLICLENITHNDVISKIKSSDCFIFIRNNNLVSNAGFPTKLVESISSGVPILTNNIGDVQKYIKNGLNGFLVEDINLDTLEDAILNIINMNDTEWKVLCNNCKNQNIFDYRGYVKTMEKFLQEI